MKCRIGAYNKDYNLSFYRRPTIYVDEQLYQLPLGFDGWSLRDPSTSTEGMDERKSEPPLINSVFSVEQVFCSFMKNTRFYSVMFLFPSTCDRQQRHHGSSLIIGIL